MRVNLSVAIVYMAADFDWDEKTNGVILGMFFYGYVLTQVPGGRMAELVGGKWLFGVGEGIVNIICHPLTNLALLMSGVLVTAVFTLVTPVAAHTSLTLLYVVRVIEGLGEGVTFPAMLAMIARWSAPEERSR